DVFLVQQRLGAVKQHVGAGVVHRRDAGGTEADDARGRAPALGAGEDDRVVQVGSENVGDAAAEDDAVGDAAQAGEVAGDQVFADRRRLELPLRLDAHDDDVDGLGAVGGD